MSVALVGYTGFVGLNLQQHFKFDYFFNSKNFTQASGCSFDTMFFTALPATKWMANKYPDDDLKNINSIIEILKTIKVNKFILISTIDIYFNTNDDVDEDYVNNVSSNSYGTHRLIFEKFIANTFANYNIIRLPALFGKQLKKNVIFDLINDNSIENIPTKSKFQWYNLDWIGSDINVILKNDIKICNLFTEPLDTIKIIELFHYPIELFKNTNEIYYNIKTKYGMLFGNNTKYVHSAMDVLNSIKSYIKFDNIDKTQLCVSNICVKKILQTQFCCLLKLFGINNVQIAPTTLIDNWNNTNVLTEKLKIFNELNVKPYSFQSITFGLNELNIFCEETNEMLLNHIFKIIDIAYQNFIKILVFGCPKNRTIKCDDTEFNQDIFVKFFNKLGNYIGNRDITICIEHNSKKYGCNFINTIEECNEIVIKINHEKIKMMIDCGNALMENDALDEIYKYREMLWNMDVANENMECLTNISTMHADFSHLIQLMNYEKMINLEMLINRDCKKNDTVELYDLVLSLNNFVNVYGKNTDIN